VDARTAQEAHASSQWSRALLGGLAFGACFGIIVPVLTSWKLVGTILGVGIALGAYFPFLGSLRSRSRKVVAFIVTCAAEGVVMLVVILVVKRLRSG
jgi:hypothetical protein